MVSNAILAIVVPMHKFAMYVRICMFVRGNNSNNPVVGRVSGVVVDEGGHVVCLE